MEWKHRRNVGPLFSISATILPGMMRSIREPGEIRCWLGRDTSMVTIGTQYFYIYVV